MWEQFRSHARALLGQHFPPELIEDNGDSIVFTDRRSWASYLLTENARGITIGWYGERDTISTIFTSPSIELAMWVLPSSYARGSASSSICTMLRTNF